MSIPQTTKRRNTLAAMVSLLVLMLLMQMAWAGPAGIRYKVKNKVRKGQGYPKLILQATGSIAGGTVELNRSDGETKTHDIGTLSSGATKTIALKQPTGTFRYEVRIDAKGKDGSTIESAFDFEATLAEKLEIAVKKDAAAVADGKLQMRSNRPIDRVEVTVKDEDGTTKYDGTVEVGGKEGVFEVEWPKVENVASVHLKAHDVDGFWRGVLLEPFWVKIPHAEVVFNFGEATWKDSEEKKLKETLETIREKMKKHGDKGLKLQLYIAGYTDTVGSKTANRELSRKRARAIGAWFSKHLNMPIYYQGFGEDVLAVDTPDETKEKKNRRAVYILGNARPPTSGTIPRSNWKRLK